MDRYTVGSGASLFWRRCRLCQEAEQGTRRGFVGEIIDETEDGSVVTDIDEDGLGVMVVLTHAGDEIVIELPEDDGSRDYDLRIPGEPAVTGVAGTLEVGAQVGVLTQLVDDEWVALQVVVKPVRPTTEVVVGAVVSVETDETGARILTIVRPDGTTKTIELGPNAAVPPEGDLVTVFSDPESEEDGGPPVANGLVRAAEVRERLNGFLEDLTENGELPPEAAQARARQVDDLASLLETHTSWHLDILQNLSEDEGLPEAGKDGILNAIENAQRGRDQALANAAEARANAGPPEGRGKPGGEDDN